MNIPKAKRIQLAKLLALVKEINTDEGVVLFVEGDMTVGTEVFVSDADGNMVPATDGTYTSEGKTITISAGKISEIKEKEEPAADPDPATDPDPKPEEGKQAKFKAVSQAFSETYEAKTMKIAAAIVALGFVDGWLVSASDTEAVWEVYEMDGGYKYIRFEVSWNGEEATVSNPVEVEPTFAPKGQAPAASVDPAVVTENETLKAENAKLKKQVADFEEKAKTPAANPIEGSNEEKLEADKSLTQRLLEFAHKNK